MVNKGLGKTNSSISLEDIQHLVEEGKAHGYIQNGKPCLSIGPKAGAFFFPDEFPPEVNEKTSVPEETKQELIPAVPPHELIPPKYSEGRAPKLYRKYGYRMAELLAEMELRGGELLGKKPHIELTRGIHGAAPANYLKAFNSLVEKGLFSASVQSDGQIRTVLTDEGRECIALLKAYPEYINKESRPKQFRGTSFRLIEHLLEEVPYDDISGSAWLMANGNETLLVEQLATELGISHDALVRRLYDLHAVKKFIEVQHKRSSYIRSSSNVITNVRVTPLGVAYHRNMVERQKEREELLDEDEVWEAEMMLQRCIRMALDSGKAELAHELKASADSRHFFEMGKKEFAERFQYLQSLQGNLLEKYAIRELASGVN